MSYAILRLSKVKNLGMATSATQHNYRLQDTPNANPDWAALNEEHLNHGHRNYWHLANERIAELHLTRLRSDAVRAVELVLTGSPEGFRRDAAGRALDVRGTLWVQDNLAFVRERFGEKNVVSFTLHQDEVTPHIHAVVVPVTTDGRLSNRDVFSPVSLRQLQTDYAKAMAPHGFERGIKYSTAIHEDVRRHYGAQQMSKEALAEVAAPAIVTTLRLEEPTAWDRVNLRGYLDRQQALLDAYLAEQIQGVNRQLEKVATVATANTLEHDRARVLQKRLTRSQRLLVSTQEELSSTKKQLQQQQELTDKALLQHRQAITRHLQNDPLPEPLAALARNERAKQQMEIEQILAKHLRLPIHKVADLAVPLLEKGYLLKVNGPHELSITHQQEGSCFSSAELRPNGYSLLEQFQKAVGRTRVQEQAQAQEQVTQTRSTGVRI